MEWERAQWKGLDHRWEVCAHICFSLNHDVVKGVSHFCRRGVFF